MCLRVRVRVWVRVCMNARARTCECVRAYAFCCARIGMVNVCVVVRRVPEIPIVPFDLKPALRANQRPF